jgi:hypothetical protein
MITIIKYFRAASSDSRDFLYATRKQDPAAVASQKMKSVSRSPEKVAAITVPVTISRSA